MARRKEKQPVLHVQMTEGKRAIIQQLLQEYDIETAQDIQDVLNHIENEEYTRVLMSGDIGLMEKARLLMSSSHALHQRKGIISHIIDATTQ